VLAHEYSQIQGALDFLNNDFACKTKRLNPGMEEA